MRLLLAAVALVAVACAQTRAPMSECQICDFMIAQAEHHFHHDITDKAALSKQLQEECQHLGRHQGPDAVTNCITFVKAHIDQIYTDLTTGKDIWQTCEDLGECSGPEPSHPTGFPHTRQPM